MNEYDDLLASEGTKDEARTNLRASVIGALPTNPDQYAEAKRLAKTTGVPAPVVERNMDEVKKQATLNEYDSLIERAPVTASKFQNPEFAKLAHDERDQLAHLEGLIGSAPRPEIYGSVLTPTGRGVFSPAEQPQPTQPPVELDPNKVRGEMLRRFGFKGASIIDRKIDGALANGTQAQLMPWDGKKAHSTYMSDALKRGVVQLGVLGDAGAYGLDRMLTAIGKRFLPEPAVPGGEVDASSGQVKASLVEVANLYSNLPRDKRTDFAGEIVNRAAAEGKTLRGIGDAIAYIATPGGAMGALNYLIEMTPSAAAGGGIGGLAAKPIAAKVASQVVARGITAAAVTGVGTTTNAFPAELAGQISEGKEVDEALGYAGTKATVEGLVNAPFGFVGGMLPLGATLTGKAGNIVGQAGLQGTGGAVGATAAAASVGEEITPGEAFLEAFFELASAPSDIAIAAAIDVAERRNTTKVQADQATASADHLTKIMQAAEASKTRARDPETFAQLVQDAAEASGTAPTEVFIDAQPLVDTLQKAGMTEAQIREALPSVAEQLGAEYTSGGTVAIPIGEAVAAFAGTGAEADLVRFARTTEDGYSVADSEQALAALDEMDADAQRIIAEQQDADAWAHSAQAVEDTLFAQLEGAGRFSSDVNRTYATILRNYYVTQAEVMGITPDALYKQFPLTASGVAPTGQVLSQPGGGVSIYHGTTPEAADAIERAGFDLSRSADGSVWFTSNKDIGEVAATGKGAVVERILDERALKLGGWVEADKYSTDEMIRMGYDGLKLEDDGEITYQIFNPEKLGRIPTTFDQEVNGTTPYTADTIEVDGKTRPAVNNKGQRIAQTDEGLRNFWRWFGDSKVVDEQSRPLVVYHGSDADIEAFKTDGQGKTAGAGVFFTSNPAVASTYTQPARGGNISPVYLKIESAAELDAAGSNWNRLGKKTKVSLPAVEVSDQADENLLAELEGREPTAGVTKKLKARKTTLGKLFPDEFVYDDDFASTDDIARWARKQGYDGLAIVDVVDRGPSGRMHTKEAADPGALFVAFTNTQIKSIFNRGTYDGSDPNTLNQSAYSDGPRLSAIHNLSAENLIFADKMGGIAVPSIGVVTEDAGGVDGFGEITLIGTKNLADPRGEPVFSSDAYTTRFPKPEWGKVKRKDADKLVAEIRPVAEEFDDRIVSQETFDGMVNNPDAAEVIHRWLSSNAIKAMFLREQGIEAKPVKREANFDTGLSQEQIESLDADYDEAMAAWRNGDREAPVVEATRAKVRAMAEVNAKAEGLSGKLLEEYLDAISDGFPRNLFNDRAKIRNGFGVDTWKTREALQADIDARAAEFKAWVEAKVLPPFGEPFIKVGREKRHYTLPNIVEVMTDSKIKGKEKTMTYGPGMVRAVTSKQFSGIEEMRAAAKDAIVDPAEYEVAKKESEAALEAYRDAVVPYTTYTDWKGAPDTWEALDSSMRALAKWATGKKRDAAGMRSALRKEGFKVDALSADTIELAITAGNALLNAPVPYFEAKPQRAVSLGEFAGAVIPANTSPDVRAILDKNGIPYREVVEGTDRQSLVREFTSELSAQGADTLFQSAYHGSPYRFSKFSLEHMGKGEGAQAYGWGLYFAGERAVAEHYRQVLANRDQQGYASAHLNAKNLVNRYGNDPEWAAEIVREQIEQVDPSDANHERLVKTLEMIESGRYTQPLGNEGQLYEVNIPDEGEYLLWDKPLSEQPEKVREALENADVMDPSVFSQYTGAQFYEGMVRDSITFDNMVRSAAQETASKFLNSIGIAGIKYLDGTSRGAGDGSYNYVIFDDNAVEILNTFYQNQPGKAEARGSFNPSTLNIALLEKADLSTFLHETGHFFFEMQVTIAARPDAPARIVNDVAILLKEVGFTGTAAEWLAQPLDARREAHEKVAESFEQYLITGDAPTVELQGLFNQMRAWMLAVYKTLKQFFATNKRAGMSTEVAGVFDRMLASDAAIAETKRVRAMSPLFTSAEAAGMTAEEWAAYQADAGQMDADARRDLDARQVRDMKWLRTARGKALKALQADASTKRRDARIEARRRLLQEPVYRAMQFLRGKVEKAEVEKKAKGLDTRRDDLLTAIAKLGGLNKDLVVAEWGIDPRDFARSPVFGKPILRGGKAGLSPDGMGEALAEVSYLQPKDGDRYSLADFEAMFNDAGRGIQHYSLDADYDLIHGYKTLPVAADLGEQPFAAGRLSRPDLEARFGGTDVDWQRLGVGRRGMIAEVGMDADAVANIVGFNTGEEMVKALLAAEPLQDATEALTDQIMLERHGDITSPEGLQRAADEALANDAHAKLLATEYARLNKAVGSPRAVQLAAKEAAERTVDRQAVRLARPEKATAAAARAGKAAEKAHAAGNLDEAAGFKRNQILNTAIARAQRELRTFVDKAQGDFAKMFGKDDQRAKTRDMNLVNLARAALAQYGLAPDAGGMKALQYLELVTQYDPALAENLKSMLAAMPEGKDFRDLTAGEFRTVASLVRGMWEMSRGVKQITIDGKKVEIDAAADELVAAVTANNGGKQGDLPGYSGTTTTADDLRVGALGIKSMLTRVEQWADFMGPAFKRFIWQPVSEAVTRYRVRRNEMVKQYRDLLKTIEPDLTFHKIHAPELGAAGFTFNAGKSEVLHAILHSGNESNLRKLLLGRGWATVDAEGNLDTSRWDAFVRRMVAEGVITRNDMDFVQGVWDLLETVKGDAQKAHRELYGYYFNEVTATPFVDPFGVERRGGYVPALADGLSSPDAMQKREQEELLHAGNSFMFPSTGKGFTQSRVEYNRPLELDLRTIGSHLDKVTRFAYIEPAVRDVGKLLLNKRVSRALNGYDQTIISQMLNPWLQRAARQTISVPGKNRWADKFFNGLRSRSGVVIMFANVVNTLQQITGFSVAALKVPAPMLLRATYRMVTEPKRMSAEAAALSPWLAERMAGQSFEMQQEIKNILVNPNPLVKGNEFLKHNAYFLQQAMQNMMDPIIWWGAYDNATANGANQRDAIRAGDEAVRTTQGTFAPEDVSAFESNTAFVRLFTQFYGYFNMLANTLGLEAKKAIRDMGYGAATPRLLFIWFAGLALPAVVAEIIARGLPDDEDDEDGDGILDEWLALFFGSQFRTLAAMVPGAGQGVSLAVNLTDDKVYNDRLSISPGMSMAETTIRGGVNLLQGEVFDERLTKAEVRDTLTLIGMATGAPTGAVARSAGYLVDVENGRADPENPVEFAVGLTTGR